MIQVTLPDGSSRSYETPQTVEQIAQSIAPSLAKAAIAATVKSDTGIETTVDTSYVVDSDVSLSIITPKDDVGLDIIRHSTAHLLAHAVKELFPDAQVTIGPVINNGFYYDFSYKRPFTPEDLQKIEKRMSELVKQDIAVIREEWDRDEAIEFLKRR